MRVSGGSAQAHDPDPNGGEDRLGPVPGLQLLVDRGQVVLHGLSADEEVAGDLAGGAAVAGLGHYSHTRVLERPADRLAQELVIIGKQYAHQADLRSGVCCFNINSTATLVP